MIYQRLFEAINKQWISEKLYALNKLPKQIRDGLLDNFPYTYNELYEIKDCILNKYGKPTGKIHKFERGIGEEWTIIKGDSFHKYYHTAESYFNKNTEKVLNNNKVKNEINKLEIKFNIQFSFYFTTSNKEEDYYEYGFRILDKPGQRNDYSISEISDFLLKILKSKSNYYTPKELMEEIEKLQNIPSTNEKNIQITTKDIEKLKKLC